MKAFFAIMGLASLASAGGGGYNYHTGTTIYETTTVCPITQTYTTSGSTYEETQYTTSTITVTECPGGECGGEVTVTGPPQTIGTTTEVDVTYTTVCPVTETKTAPGGTYYETYTTTSVYVTKLHTIVYETATGPAVTKTEGDVVYETLTSLCPVTETKTIEGETVVVTWTSTSTIKTEVQTTATAYTSYTVTEHVETEVYETVTCPETTYKTVSEGETVYVTETGTETTSVTKEYTVTETIPVTLTKEIDVTITQEVSEGETVTEKPTVIITYSDTNIITQVPPPTTIEYPTTISTANPTSVGTTYIPQPPASSSYATAVPTALAAHATPAAAVFLLGAAGIAALL